MKILFLLTASFGDHQPEAECLTEYSGAQGLTRGLVEGCLRRNWHFEALRYSQAGRIKLKEALRRCPADAVVCNAPATDKGEARYRAQWAKRHPLVEMAPPTGEGSPIGRAYVDETHAVERLATHLVAEGFASIDFVGRPVRHGAMERRYHALQAYAARQNLPAPRFLALPHRPDTSIPFLDRVPEIEAVVCFNDLMAWDLIHRLKSAGRRVPRDLAVCGMDGIPSFAGDPVLTTAVFDWGRVAEQALCRIEEKRLVRPRPAPLVPPTLRVGATSLKRSLKVPGKAATFLRMAEENLELHFRDPDCAGRAASACGVTRPHFLRQYRALRGESFTQRVLGRRLAFMAEAIVRGAGPIHPMARTVGFKNHIYFYRAFKKRFGTTPLAWRRQHRAT